MGDSNVYFNILVTVLVCAALLTLIALPLAFRTIPRNGVYGFRTPRTLSSDAIWYSANAFFGRACVIANLVSAMVMLIIYQHPPSLPQEYLIKLSLAVLLAPLIIAVVLTFVHIHTLDKKPR